MTHHSFLITKNKESAMPYHLSTQAVHAGEEKRKPFGALTTPVYQTSTYTFEDTAAVLAFMDVRPVAISYCAMNMGATATQQWPLSRASWQPLKVVNVRCSSPAG
jgi:cystathionine beta-lyase/cystathionine gamma-synthase